MQAKDHMNSEQLSRRLAGQVISRVAEDESGSMTIRFASGSALVVGWKPRGLAVSLLESEDEGTPSDSGPRPTRRQREYLEFIKRYIHRFGVAPAESDIRRHFMVSPPSVNQMMRTLEQRGFITRERDFSGQAVPRSIRVLLEDW